MKVDFKNTLTSNSTALFQGRIEFRTLREAREYKGVTQQGLAKLMKTKQASISRAESAMDRGEWHKVSLRFCKRAMDALNGYVVPPKIANP